VQMKRLLGAGAEAVMMGDLHGLFFAAAVVAMMAVGAPVQAGLKTGNDLYRDCARDSEREPFCLGYIVSVIETTRVLGARFACRERSRSDSCGKS
jgi:hypothetical protein